MCYIIRSLVNYAGKTNLDFLYKTVNNVLKHWRIGLLGALVSMLAIAFIATQVNLTLFGEAWSEARYIYIVPCALLLVAGLVTRALRWQILLSGRLSLWRAFNITNVAYLVNGVLPLRIGEVARIYLARRTKKPIPVMQSASTIVVERLLDLLAVVVLTALALAAGTVPDELRNVGVVIAPLALFGFLFLIWLAGRREFAAKILSAIVERLPVLERFHLLEWLDDFLEGLQPLAQTSALFKALLWTAVSWALSVIAGYVLMFAFYEQGDWATTALFIAAASFAIAVPAVPGNVGTYEASILLALGAMGYDPTSGTALAFAVMVHGVNVGVYTVTGVMGFIQEGVSPWQLSRGVRQMQQTDTVEMAEGG